MPKIGQTCLFFLSSSFFSHVAPSSIMYAPLQLSNKGENKYTNKQKGMNLSINDTLGTIKNIFFTVSDSAFSLRFFSMALFWRLIQGGRPCLGTDKTHTSNTCQALVLHQRSLQSTFMLLQGRNYAMFLFIIERRDSVKERDVKRNWDHTEIEDKCCFCWAALSINTSRHTCSPLKYAV